MHHFDAEVGVTPISIKKNYDSTHSSESEPIPYLTNVLFQPTSHSAFETGSSFLIVDVREK